MAATSRSASKDAATKNPGSELLPRICRMVVDLLPRICRQGFISSVHPWLFFFFYWSGRHLFRFIFSWYCIPPPSSWKTGWWCAQFWNSETVLTTSLNTWCHTKYFPPKHHISDLRCVCQQAGCKKMCSSQKKSKKTLPPIYSAIFPKRCIVLRWY